jgi:hypothetical protein
MTTASTALPNLTSITAEIQITEAFTPPTFAVTIAVFGAPEIGFTSRARKPGVAVALAQKTKPIATASSGTRISAPTMIVPQSSPYIRNRTRTLHQRTRNGHCSIQGLAALVILPAFLPIPPSATLTPSEALPSRVYEPVGTHTMSIATRGVTLAPELSPMSLGGEKTLLTFITRLAFALAVDASTSVIAVPRALRGRGAVDAFPAGDTTSTRQSHTLRDRHSHWS